MKITNHGNLPEALVRAVTNDPYPTGGTGDISVTRLIDAPRIRVLRKRHESEIEEDVGDRIWALMGQAVHQVLDRANGLFDEAITEHRLFADIGGWRVSGQFDRVDLSKKDQTLSDYKMTSGYAVLYGAPKMEWVKQLNCLAYLANQNKYRVKNLDIIAVIRDWSKYKALQSKHFPQANVVRLPVDLWPTKKQREYMEARVIQHRAAEELPDEILPFCTADERWAKPDTWAIMREGRKTAVKLFDSEPTAEAFLAICDEKHRIEKRPGVSVRCAEYCAVSRFCSQYQAEQELNLDGETANENS